jgi:hypothetical protein
MAGSNNTKRKAGKTFPPVPKRQQITNWFLPVQAEEESASTPSVEQRPIEQHPESPRVAQSATSSPNPEKHGGGEDLQSDVEDCIIVRTTSEVLQATQPLPSSATQSASEASTSGTPQRHEYGSLEASDDADEDEDNLDICVTDNVDISADDIENEWEDVDDDSIQPEDGMATSM